MFPEVRSDRLLTQEVGDELVIYDERTQRAHRLNGTARMVWRLADGSRSVEELAALLRAHLQASASGGLSAADRGQALGLQEAEALVRLALQDMAQAGLLARPLGMALPGEATSRRQILTTAAAVLVPVIASIVAPSAADAQSSPSGPPQVTPASFNGTYLGTGTLRAGATCGDDNFPPMVNVRGVLALNVGAANPWVKTHLPDTVYAFSNPQATVQFNNSLLLSATGVVAPDNFFNYTAIEAYGITGSNLSGTQTFSVSECVWIYDITMTRQ